MIDSTLCPLCGNDNRCAMEIERATGVRQQACWCTQVDFGADLMAKLPARARGKACICAACARAHAGSPTGVQEAVRPSSLAFRKPPVP